MFSKLAFVSTLALAAAQLGTAAPPAPEIKNNAAGVSYGATFTGKQGAGITGFVTMTSNTNGTGTVINVNLANLPAQSPGGPFLYHIHQFRVPADGNCTATGGHLDPENRGEQPPCDATDKASCQVGDLAGKYGKMTTSPWQLTYTDLYTSTTPGSPAFVGNRSIVIHDLNTTRIACVNIEMLDGGVPSNGDSSNTSAGSASPTGASNATSASSVATATSFSSVSASGTAATAAGPSPTIAASNGANSIGMTGGAMFLAAAAFLL